jgi:diacylglycerol kinase family enzyme
MPMVESRKKKWSYFKNNTDLVTSQDIVYDNFETGDNLQNELKKAILHHIHEGHVHFVAAGGDGTVNALVNAIADLPIEYGQKVIMGAIGLGSSNDFHKPNTNQLPSIFGKIPYCLDFEKIQKHDLCMALFKNEKKYFIINAGLGITANGNNIFNNKPVPIKLLKMIHIELAIFYASALAFITYKPQSVQINYTTKNGKSVTNSFFLSNFGIVKNRHFAGSLHYPIGPDKNDGLFEIYGFYNMGYFKIIRCFISLYKGIVRGGKNTIQDSVSNIEFSSIDEFPFETDGEVFLTKKVSFKIDSRGVNICQ